MSYAYLPSDPSGWRALAACRGRAVFFDPARETQAKALCATCTVRAECLAFALGNDERDGVWGGLTENERRRERDNRRRAQCGTASGYRRHRHDGEEACPECKAANAADKRGRYVPVLDDNRVYSPYNSLGRHRVLS